jgi:hypothetical protein
MRKCPMPRVISRDLSLRHYGSTTQSMLHRGDFSLSWHHVNITHRGGGLGFHASGDPRCRRRSAAFQLVTAVAVPRLPIDVGIGAGRVNRGQSHVNHLSTGDCQPLRRDAGARSMSIRIGKDLTGGGGSNLSLFIDSGRLATGDPIDVEWISGRGEAARLID